MATDDSDDPGIDVNQKLSFNGIDADTGNYLFPPASTAELADLITGKTPPQEDLNELKARQASKGEGHYGVKEGVDPTKLEEAGWGVIFPAVKPGTDEEKEQAAIYDALAPLLAHRKAQAAKLKDNRYKEYRGPDGYRPGESKQKYLARLGVAPGPADPDKVPYYLLVVGSPRAVPYHVQYQIDVQYAVGRIHFDTVEEYANYARSVVAAETTGLSLAREVAFVGVANPDDMATQLSRKNLVGPLSDMVQGWSDVPGWRVSRYFDGDANKATVSEVFGGPRTPALVFTGSHGMGFKKGDPKQVRHQGALLLQDWAGPRRSGPIGEDLYLSGDDIASDASLLGMIAFNFACYGAGTPEFDEFSKQSGKERKAISDGAFVAGLHKRLLGHPKGGALATIGHVERAWGYSFMWGTGKKGAQSEQLAVFESTLRSLMKGMPVGMAVEFFNERYAEMASDLSRAIEEMEFDPSAADPFSLASMWTSSNDARGYAVMGDPAVRLPLARAGEEGTGRERGAINLSSATPTAAPAGASPAPEAAAPAPAVAAFMAPPVTPAAEPVVAEAAPPVAAADVHFGLFGGGEPARDAEAKPGAFQGFVAKLGKALEDAVTLEVRTYVSSNVSAAAASDRATLARDADLRAFTRVMINGNVDAVVPQRDGVVDTTLWNIHLELVKQAQQARAETIKTVLSALSGLLKV